MHLAAESHVDRSIEAPVAFIDTNIIALTGFSKRPETTGLTCQMNAGEASAFITFLRMKYLARSAR